MSNPYGSMTRLESAKEALETWISDLMIQSKQNETAVVVLKTMTTDHHLDQDYFPNLTIMPSNGVTRPTVSLLRDIECVPCSEMSEDLRGDLMDGLVVAADAIRRRTLGKMYQRSIVILTDACHKVVIDEEQVLQVVDALRDMKCKLHVIGLDFVESAVFEEALPESEAAAVKEEDICDDDARRETERFLISVARLTGGSVQAAHSLHQMLRHKLGKRITASTRRKCSLLVAPTMDPLPVRVSLLVSKTNMPTLKKEATLLDENNEPLRDGLGNFITSELA
jgi:Ku70/Ku80 N-terminal alpha/beta domain